MSYFKSIARLSLVAFSFLSYSLWGGVNLKNGNFYVGNIAKLKLNNLSNKFDFVYSTQVIEHVVEQEEFIKNCGKLLKKEGYCYI